MFGNQLLVLYQRLVVTFKLAVMEVLKERCGSSENQCDMLLLSVGDALYAIGGKWKLKVIIALFTGTKRFNELQRTINGISAKVLSNELKELESNGFVRRIVHAESTPVVVEYHLTEYSNSLQDVVTSLSQWGTKHREKIKSESGNISIRPEPS
jgi:DNA-binding HxlR family transcriptional regulator